MMRRSRISVRPNVRPGGRGLTTSSQDPKPSEETAAEPQKAPEESQEAGKETQKQVSKAHPGDPGDPSHDEAGQKPTQEGQQISTPHNLNAKSEEGAASASTSSPAATVQRRKRFSAMPNLAKPRAVPASAQPRARATPKSPPAKHVASPAVEDKAPTSPERTQAENAPRRTLTSPARRRSSGGKQPKAAEEKSEASACSSQPLSAGQDNTASESSQKRTLSPKVSQESTSAGSTQQLTESSLPGQKESQCSDSSPKEPSPKSSVPLNKPSISSDRERILKARKLRELLQQEIQKEKKLKKGKVLTFETPVPQDRSKMIMRDFIYYLPESNPMKSSLEQEQRQTETVTTLPPNREPSVRPQEEEEGEEDEDEDEPVQDDQLLVPRVKVAEDGSLIIDEESLTVEVLRVKGPNVVEQNDPIFERGSTTTYSSFRKASYTKPWSNRETDMFFLAISMVGTDFSMIGQLFPHRARTEIKNKFKKEERTNSWRIDKAFREKRPFDIDFFSKLLEKAQIEDAKKKEKPRRSRKNLTESTSARPRSKRKKKVSDQDKAAEGSFLVSGSGSEDEEGDPELAEKENEESFSVHTGEDGESSQAGPAARKKRKHRKDEGAEDATSERPLDTKKRQRKRKKTCEEGPTDMEVISCEEPGNGAAGAEVIPDGANRSQETESPAKEGKESLIQPAQPARHRSQKPKPKLTQRRGGKRAAEALETPGAKSRTEGEQGTEGGSPDSTASKEPDSQGPGHEGGNSKSSKGKKPKRVKKHTNILESSDSENPGEDMEEDPDLTAVQEHMLNKPTRSGRIPKFSQHLKQPEEEDNSPVASPSAVPPSPEDSPASRRGRDHSATPTKDKPSLDQNQKTQRAGKAKLLTLRASPEEPEENEEEADEGRAEEDYCYPTNLEEVNQAPAFVPASLRSPTIVPVEVEETMEELEISDSVPDGRCSLESEQTHFSQSLCDEALCRASQEEVVVPSENQLDILVDVIEIFSTGSVSEFSGSDRESNTEAAQTLLTIRNSEFVPPEADGRSTGSEDAVIEASCQRVEEEEETSGQLGSEQTEQPDVTEAPQAAVCDSPAAVTPSETSDTTARASPSVEEPQKAGESSGTVSGSDEQERAAGPASSAQNGTQHRRTRFSKLKPNLVRTARGPQVQPVRSGAPRISCDSLVEPTPVDSAPQRLATKEKSVSDSDEEKDIPREQGDTEASGDDVQKEKDISRVPGSPEVTPASSATNPGLPAQNEGRFRRSRFPRPKPNLGRTVRDPQTGQDSPKPAPSRAPQNSAASSDVPAPITSVPPLSSEEHQPGSNSSKDKDGTGPALSKKPGEDAQKQEGTPGVSEESEGSAEMSALCQSSSTENKSQSRRSRFPRPKPNLGSTARGLQIPVQDKAPHKIIDNSVQPAASMESVQQQALEQEETDLNSMKENEVHEVPGEQGDKKETAEHEQENSSKVSEVPEVTSELSSRSPDSSVQSGSRFRRSRFPKPKPNVGGTARSPQTGSDRCGASLKDTVTDASVDSAPQQSVAEETSDSSCIKEKEILREHSDKEESCEEALKKEDKPRALEAHEVTAESSAKGPDSSAQNGARFRRAQFQKPKPILSRAATGPRTRTHSGDPQHLPAEDCSETAPSEVGTPEMIVENVGCDQLRKEGNNCRRKLSSEESTGDGQADIILAKENRSEEAAKREPSKVRTRSNQRPTVSSPESSLRRSPRSRGILSRSLDKTEDTPEAIGTTQDEVTSIQVDDVVNNAVTTEDTEGASDRQTAEVPQQEHTIILTLFEIPPSSINMYEEGTGAMGIASDALMPLPVFVEPVPAELLGMPPFHSCGQVSVETAEDPKMAKPGCGSLSDPAGRYIPQPASSERQGRGMEMWTPTQQRTLSVADELETGSLCNEDNPEGPSQETTDTTAVKHSMESPAHSCAEGYARLTLEPVVESSESVGAGTEGTSDEGTQKKRKLPVRTRRGKLQVKPNTSKRKPVERTEGRGKSETLPAQEDPPSRVRTTQCEDPRPEGALGLTGESQSSAAEVPPQRHRGREGPSNQDSLTSAERDTTESSSGEENPSSNLHIKPSPSGAPLIRPGRKPRGFLSFISEKSTPTSPSVPKTCRSATHKPQINTSGMERRKRTAVVAAMKNSSNSSSDSPPGRRSQAWAFQSKLSPQSTCTPGFKTRTLESPPQPPNEVLCVDSSNTDEEPTKVSEYFFSDIFTEVDEPD